MKFRPYFTMELVQKLMKNNYKYLIYSPLTEKILTECPCISLLDFLKISQKPRRKAENPNSEIKVLRMALCCPIPSFRSLVVTNKHCCEPGGWSWSVNMSTMSTATLTLFSPRNCSVLSIVASCRQSDECMGPSHRGDKAYT